MSEIKKQNSDEIDLISIFLIIWAGKFKLMFFVISVISITFIYLNSKQTNFRASTKIEVGDYKSFAYFQPINYLLSKNFSITSDNQNFTLIEPNVVFKMIINEFNSNKQVQHIIANKKEIQETLLGLSNNEKVYKIKTLAKSFKISKDPNDKNGFLISYSWDDINVGNEIVEKAMEIAVKNVQEKIIDYIYDSATIIKKKKDLEVLALKNKLKAFIEIEVTRKIGRLEFLKEQLEIAKKLKVKNSEINTKNINPKRIETQSYLESNQAPYYLRGYLLIQEEINQLYKRSRQNIEIMSNEIREIKSNISEIKSFNDDFQLAEFAKKAKTQNTSRWIYYNLSNSNIKSNKDKNNLYYFIFSFISLFIGIIYLYVSHTINLNKAEMNK